MLLCTSTCACVCIFFLVLSWQVYMLHVHCATAESLTFALYFSLSSFFHLPLYAFFICIFSRSLYSHANPTCTMPEAPLNHPILALLKTSGCAHRKLLSFGHKQKFSNHFGSKSSHAPTLHIFLVGISDREFIYQSGICSIFAILKVCNC